MNPFILAWRLGLWLLVLSVLVTIGWPFVLVWFLIGGRATIKAWLVARARRRRFAELELKARQMNLGMLKQVNQDIRDLAAVTQIPPWYWNGAPPRYRDEAYWAAVHPGYDR